MAIFAYDVVFALSGQISNSDTIPGSILPVECFPSEVDFSANFGSSVGSVQTNPTSTATFIIYKNGGNVGTIVVAVTGTVTFTSAGGVPVTYNTNDNLDIGVPGVADATLEGMRFTLRGTVTI